MTFPNHIIGFMKPKGLNLCPEYEAVYNAQTTKPSDADALAYNAWMLSMVGGGYYAKSEFLDVMFAHSNADNEAKLDWRSPSDIGTSLIPHTNGYDWPDDNADGVGNGWALASGAGACSIVIGNGFTDNAQRINHVNGTNTRFQYSTGVNAVSGQRYRVKGKYRCGAIWWGINLRVVGGDPFFMGATSGFVVNAGNALFFEFTVIATVNAEIVLNFSKASAQANDYLEIDEIEVMSWNHNPTLVNNPVFTNYTGFIGDSVNLKYLNLNFIPSTNCVISGQDNMCFIIGVGTDLQADLYDFGSSGAANLHSTRITSRGVGNIAYFAINRTGANGAVCNNSIAHFALSRGFAANYDYYRNLVKTNIATASTGLSPSTFTGCAYNSNGAVAVANKCLRYVFCLSYLIQAEVQAVIGLTNTLLSTWGTNLY